MKSESSSLLHFRHALFLVLVALSGAAALGHQLLWTRRLTDLLGASTESSVRVFGCFFLGLGLGSAIAAWKGSRVKRPFRVLMWLELAIAVLSVPILFLPQWTDWIWPTLGSAALTDWRGGMIKLLLSFFVVTPPAALMGAGFPILLRGVLQNGRVMNRQGVDLYAGNTLGGVAGLLLAAGWLIPAAGGFGSMAILISVSFVLAVAFWCLDRKWGGTTEEESTSAENAKRPGESLGYPAILMLSFFSGAGVLAAEVAGLKMLTLVATISFHTVTGLLGAVILTLALSAWLVRPALRLSGSAKVGAPLFVALAGILLCVAPLIFMAIVRRENPFIGHESLWAYSWSLLLVTLMALGPGLFFAGLVFPTLLHWLGSEGGDEQGRRVGWLLALNGLGGLLGAEAAHLFLVPQFGTYRTFGLIGMVYIGVGAALAFRRGGGRSMLIGRVTTVCSGIAVLVLLAGKLGSLPHVNIHAGFSVIEEKHGREGHLAIVEHPNLGKAMLVSNQYLLGSETAKYDQERQAHLPLILHPEPKRVGFIGHATGMTPGGALLHETVEEVVSVEISPSVVEAAAEHFHELNHGVGDDDRVRVLTEDGRAYFAACDSEFDVIEADLFLPWGPGVGRLYSFEHFSSVHRALRQGGIFCQWLPMYQLTSEQFDLIAATFQRVFSDVYLFRGTFVTNAPSLALVGFRDEELSWSVVSDRCRAIRDSGMITDPVVRHPEAVAMLYLGKLPQKNTNGVNTLNNMRLELDASETRLTGSSGEKFLLRSRWLDWMRELDGKFETSDLEEFEPRYWVRVGEAVSIWEETARRKDPRADKLRTAVRKRMPKKLYSDPSADWRQWPSIGRP